MVKNGESRVDCSGVVYPLWASEDWTQLDPQNGSVRLINVCRKRIFFNNRSDALLELIQTAFGPAKAFGCGLLSLARG